MIQSERKTKATLLRVDNAFGCNSKLYKQCLPILSEHFHKAKKYDDVKTAYEQWKQQLSVAYSSFDDNGSNFAAHTYLSVFSKLVAYSVVSNHKAVEENTIAKIIEGNIFNSYNLSGFIERDCYSWINHERSFKTLKKVVSLISGELSRFDFTNADSGVFKDIYEGYTNIDTWFSIGECHTPDWLCERIVLDFDIKETDRILEPAFGSGSFIWATIKKLKRLYSDITVEQICNQIYGIEVHPLSVQLVKTTMLILLNNEIMQSKKPIRFNLFCANALADTAETEGLKHSFDYIVGNPSWFAIGSIKNEQYRTLLNDLADAYAIKPSNKKVAGQLQVCSIFASYCNDNFLKPDGKIAFVFPESFFKEKQHNNLRSGKVKDLKITGIWSLANVSPTFRVPCIVLFTEKTVGRKRVPVSDIDGIVFSGELPNYNNNYVTGFTELTEEAVKWYYVKENRSSEISLQVFF